MSGSVTILTLLAMVACFAPGAEAQARRDTRGTRILACHDAMGWSLVVVREVVGRPMTEPREPAALPSRVSPAAPVATLGEPPLRDALLNLPPPVC